MPDTPLRIHRLYPHPGVEMRAKALYDAQRAPDALQWEVCEHPEPWWAKASQELQREADEKHA